MSPKALEHQAFGRFLVDIRACNGRKGFPHVAMDELSPGERMQVRARLLGTIQAAVQEGVLAKEDLVLLAGVVPDVDPQQMPVLVTTVRPTRSVQVSPSRSVRIKPIQE